MQTTTALLQVLSSGIGTGAVYALVALGFNVVFKSTGAMNFAQGEWVVMGGMVTALLIGTFSSVGLAVVAAVVLVGVVGLLSERLTVQPLKRPDALVITLVTIGLSIVSRSLVMLVLGKKPVGYAGFSGNTALSFGGVSIQSQTLWIIAITLAFLVVMHAFFERTILGKALRAAAADREAAAIVGVNVGSTVLLSFGIAALAGALAGAIVTPLTLRFLRPGRHVRLQGVQRRHAGRPRQPAGGRGGRAGAGPAGGLRQLLHLVRFQGCHRLCRAAAHPVRFAPPACSAGPTS